MRYSELLLRCHLCHLTLLTLCLLSFFPFNCLSASSIFLCMCLTVIVHACLIFIKVPGPGFLCVPLCHCVSLRASVCLCMPLCACALICVSLCASACLCVLMRASVCLCVPLRASVCHIYSFVSLCEPVPLVLSFYNSIRLPFCASLIRSSNFVIGRVSRRGIQRN